MLPFSHSAHSLPAFAALLLAVILTWRPAFAGSEEPRPEHVAAARALAIEGIRLADDGNCSAALERLERAEALYHAPTILARLGECQVLLGKLVLGTETLNRVVREVLPKDAPRAFRDAQERARRVLADAALRIPKLTVHVEPTEASVRLTVDGAPVPRALLDVPMPLDPGARRITVRAPGYKEQSRQVELREGSAETLEMRLEEVPSGVDAPGPVSGPSKDGPPERADSGAPGGTRQTVAYVLLGVGGAGIVAGSVFGLLAIGKEGDLANDCPDKSCSENSGIDAAKDLALAADIGFGVGALGLGAGAVLLLLGEGSSAEGRTRVSGKIEPWLGFGSAGVRGSF